MCAVSPAGCWGAPGSPGSAHGETRLARPPCDTQRGAGHRGSQGSAGDCDLPFPICKGLAEKGWRWFLAVHNSQMSRLAGVFAQSSGCAALQNQAQEELLLFPEGRPKLFGQPPSVITATVAGKLSLPRPSRETLPSGCCSLCSPGYAGQGSSLGVQSCHFGGGSLFPILLIATFMLPG